MIGNLYVLKGHNCHKKYPTQLTVTLQNCRKVLEEFSSLFSGFCTIFCKFDHCVGSTRGKATRATNTVGLICKK